VARGGAIGWVQPEEGNLFGHFSTRVSAEEHGKGVFLRAKCVIKTVGNDDMVVFRLWSKFMLAEESLWTISQGAAPVTYRDRNFCGLGTSGRRFLAIRASLVDFAEGKSVA
jgi:hypothetical protein